MNIREWPADERPREKLLVRGAAACRMPNCSPCCWGRALPGETCWTWRAGCWCALAELKAVSRGRSPSPFARAGLGPVKCAQLQALLEIGRRYLDESIERTPAMESPAAVRRYLKAMLRHEASEVFGCLFLDSKHRPLAFEILFRGTIDRASIYPREVVRRALMHNAAALILRGYGVNSSVSLG